MSSFVTIGSTENKRLEMERSYNFQRQIITMRHETDADYPIPFTMKDLRLPSAHWSYGGEFGSLNV